MSDKPEEAEPKKKGGGKMKIIVMVVVLLVLVGGGVGAGVFAASSGLIGGGHAAAPDASGFRGGRPHGVWMRSRIREPSASFANGFVRTCMPGLRCP